MVFLTAMKRKNLNINKTQINLNALPSLIWDEINAARRKLM